MRWLLLSLLVVTACGDDVPATPDADPACVFRTAADDVEPPPIHTPRWAFRPWISKDISDDADTRAFVAGFADRDIPVGAVVLDSPWETHYNTFVPNPTRYPDFDQLVADLHAADIKIVLWTTQMVNSSGFDLEDGGDDYDGASPNYDPGQACGFFVDDGADYLWWKGTGAGVDFFDEQAVAWWHRQQDALLDLGIDGWKLDFGEQYLQGEPFDTDRGPVSLQAYSEAYYADFYAYGAARRGREFVTMVRPWDKSYQWEGRFYARPEHAPVAWVGDNRRDWLGLADALDHTFRSAAAGYVVIGSDVGGYLDRDELNFDIILPFDSLVFARWTAASALMPFFQLHGRANLEPWAVPDHVDETLAMYRYWATLHDQLVPFLYARAEEAYRGGAAMVAPLGDQASWAGDYRWILGGDLLVAPILDASGARDVSLPAGRWYDWWQPGGPAIVGPIVLDDVTPVPEYDRIPVYVREGAIVPLEVAGDATGLGSAASADEVTWLIWPAATAGAFSLRDDDGAVTTTVTATAGASIDIGIADAERPSILRVRVAAAPAGVSRDGGAVAAVGSRDEVLSSAGDAWYFDGAASMLWLRVGGGANAAIVITP